MSARASRQRKSGLQNGGVCPLVIEDSPVTNNAASYIAKIPDSTNAFASGERGHRKRQSFDDDDSDYSSNASEYDSPRTLLEPLTNLDMDHKDCQQGSDDNDDSDSLLFSIAANDGVYGQYDDDLFIESLRALAASPEPKEGLSSSTNNKTTNHETVPFYYAASSSSSSSSFAPVVDASGFLSWLEPSLSDMPGKTRSSPSPFPMRTSLPQTQLPLATSLLPPQPPQPPKPQSLHRTRNEVNNNDDKNDSKGSPTREKNQLAQRNTQTQEDDDPVFRDLVDRSAEYSDVFLGEAAPRNPVYDQLNLTVNTALNDWNMHTAKTWAAKERRDYVKTLDRFALRNAAEKRISSAQNRSQKFNVNAMLGKDGLPDLGNWDPELP